MSRALICADIDEASLLNAGESKRVEEGELAMQTIHEPKQANKQTYKNHFPLPHGKMSNVNWREGSRSTGTERIAAAS